jgi:hypothetical protein
MKLSLLLWESEALPEFSGYKQNNSIMSRRSIALIACRMLGLGYDG